MANTNISTSSQQTIRLSQRGGQASKPKTCAFIHNDEIQTMTLDGKVDEVVTDAFQRSQRETPLISDANNLACLTSPENIMKLKDCAKTWEPISANFGEGDSQYSVRNGKNGSLIVRDDSLSAEEPGQDIVINSKRDRVILHTQTALDRNQNMIEQHIKMRVTEQGTIYCQDERIELKGLRT